MGNIFVRRPIFAMVIAIMIVVLGLIAIRSMPIEQYPDISPPVVEVSAEYLGADALTIEQSVATPLEESVNGVSDMIYMQSTNSNNGSMSLQVSFAVGTDPDMNTIFTQNRVSSATPMLPQVVIKQGVTTEKTMSSFIQVLSLYSDGRYDENFLGNYAILHIKDRLARINGVGSVQVMGGGAYAMRIWVKPDRMDYLGVTVADIASAIEQQSEVIPGGQLGAEPNDGSAQFTYTVRMPAQYNTVEQFERIVLRAEPDGSLVYLKDVADVELGSQTYDVYSTYQQQPSSMIMINQSPGSNAVEVGKEVNAAMRELSQSFPEGMHYHTIVDSTRTILLGIHDIVVTLALALLLVVLVIYLFLQNIRATIVPIIAIPVSLVGAFMVFPLFGFSINVFSLLGLVLAIGLVVDDAIVDLPKTIFMVDGKLAEDILFVGSQIPMANAQGQRMLGVVKEIGDDTVKMDFNHPMAGKTLNFDVEVISVRDVTPEDLAGKCSCGECSCGDDCHCEGESHATAATDLHPNAKAGPQAGFFYRRGDPMIHHLRPCSSPSPNTSNRFSTPAA